MLLWIIAPALALTGAALLWRGLRGRRLNDHPICRKCKFDLVGVYDEAHSEVAHSEVAQLSELCATRSISQHPEINTSENSPSTHSSESCATVNRCPECGRDLHRKRAVRYGARQKRPIAITAGALLLLICAGVGGAWGWGRANSFNWNTIKPEWMLMHSLHQPTGGINEPVFDELRRRAANGSLSDSALRKMAIETLGRQAEMYTWRLHRSSLDDAKVQWTPQWAKFVHCALDRKLLTPAQAVTFFRHTLFPDLEVDHHVPSESVLRIALNHQLDFAGYPNPTLALHGDFAFIATGGVVLARDVGQYIIRLWEHSGGFGKRIETPLPNIAPGLHRFAIVRRYQFYAACDARLEPHDHPEPPDYSWRETDIVHVLVQPHDAPQFELVVKPELREAMLAEAKKRFGVIRVIDNADWGFHSDHMTHRSFPVGLCHEIFVITSAGEVSDGLTILHPSGGSRRGWNDDPFPTFDETVTVVLRPNLDIAIKTPGVQELWGEEIVIENVPVIRMTAEEVRRELDEQIQREWEKRNK